ncbi:hypothetical protein SCUCBS95973_002917 [Sporothrix curviconia]|uniref:Carboxylesterase type B domain-containing protein n=1 Tax=Sporothrix curviconia TaxID=1260050 RepID=A0ABP0BBA8_9PEZI
MKTTTCLQAGAMLFSCLPSVLGASVLLETSHERRVVAAVSETPIVQTRNGSYQGYYLAEYDQDLFLGIPFAKPPTGHLRFRNPESLNETWTGTRWATGYAMECIGYGGDQKGHLQSEDCLYLNVIRPHGYENVSLPLLVWIHGGGFKEGGTPDLRYNLTFIVQNSVKIGKPIMAAGIAYRLGPFGFLNGEQPAGEGVLNLGLKDQRLALHWIQENIAAFGADPSKVTIYGQSAGAESVGHHIRAFNGRNDSLFRAGIMESGPVLPGSGLNVTEDYQGIYDTVVYQTGCTDSVSQLDCLRHLPFTVLNNVLNTTANGLAFSWNPTIDGDFIARYPSEQIRDGDFVKVPIIAGTTTDEGTTQCPKPVNTTTELKVYMNTTSSYQKALPESVVTQLIAFYSNVTGAGIPSNQELGGNVNFTMPYGTAFRQTAGYFGDAVFIGGRRLTCQTWAAHNLTAYCYRFNTIPHAEFVWEDGVAHFADLAFIMNNIQGYGYPINPFANISDSVTELSYLMAGSWASFVTDLDPNNWTGRGRNYTQNGVQWPVYTADSPQNMVWDANVTSYVEPDTWRAAGIQLINDNAENYGR